MVPVGAAVDFAVPVSVLVVLAEAEYTVAVNLGASDRVSAPTVGAKDTSLGSARNRVSKATTVYCAQCVHLPVERCVRVSDSLRERRYH